MAVKLRMHNGYVHGGGLSLPEDIIMEFLLRLPAKALCRFRCVSRSWRALISDPAFVVALRSRATSTLIVATFEHELRLLDKGGNSLMVFDVRCRRETLAPTRLDCIFVDRGQLGAMIIDPASRRNFTIVGPNDPPPPSWADSTVHYSFGRAKASGDYKVLRLATSLNRFHPNQWCQVATIIDDVAELTWKQKPWGPFYSTSFSCDEKATINGVLYFMLRYSEYHRRNLIVAFDLDSEEWKPKNSPLLGNKNKDDKWRITLTELKGTLCMVHNVQHLADLLGGHYVDIWLLKDPKSCAWVKEYKINMHVESLLLFTKPLDVLTDGNLLLLNGFWKARNSKNCLRYILQIYNTSTKASTNFMEMAPGFTGGMAFYTGSLQS